MRRLIRWLRETFGRRRPEPAWTPFAQNDLLYDPAFVRATFRPGERFDPLASTVEEYDA